jgi:hypothetical protein
VLRQAHNPAMPTRSELHEIVDMLPEETLERGLTALRHVKDGPPKAMAQGRDAAFARMQERMQERFKAMQERSKDSGRPMAFAGVGGGGGRMGPDGKGSSNYSFGYTDEDGSPVREITTITDGHEVTITERLRVDETDRTMRVKLDVRGPDGTTGQFDHTFKLL